MAKKQESAHGPCPFVVAVGCSDPDHHPARDLLALTGAIMAYSTTSPTSRAVPAAAVVADAAASAASAVSWAAIFAGAFGAVAVSIILIELGLGLGFSSTSAWPNSGASLATLGVMGGVWLILVQWIASAIGGYLAGRLRTKWTGVHTDEVFFRDTAHGFLAWSLATVIGVLLIAVGSATVINATSRVVGGAASAGTAAATNAASQQVQPIGDRYYVDMLYRPGNAAPSGAPQATGANQAAGQGNAGNDRAMVLRIFARDLPKGGLTPEDRTYVAQSVATRSGISQSEAEQRVDQTVAQIKSAEDQARQAAEKVRKATAFGAIVTALAMVVGAFIASVSAALGGKLRDEY
jgi:hypothetical protein